MSNMRVKWRKGVRTWRLQRQARALVAQAGRAGRTGPPVLVTNLAQMGDVVLTAGVAAALRARHPDSPLLVAVQPQWLALLDGDPLLDGALGLETLFEARALAKSGPFETVYVLDIPIPNLIHYFDGVPNVFRYAPPTTGDWAHHGRNLMTFYEDNAGLERGAARPRVWVRPEDQAHADALLRSEGLLGPESLAPGGAADAPPLIALHTLSSLESKTWPLDRFAALAARWHEARGAHFVVLGAPGEAAALRGLPGVTHLAGRVTLPQTAAVIARCDLFVGLDSGLAYAAEAAGVPGLVLLGATAAETCGPRSARFTFLRAPGACLPACHAQCGRPTRCIESLTVDLVDATLAECWRRHVAAEASCASL